MQGLIFNNREWLALFLTVDHTITDGAIDVILIETSKISMSVNKKYTCFYCGYLIFNKFLLE